MHALAPHKKVHLLFLLLVFGLAGCGGRASGKPLDAAVGDGAEAGPAVDAGADAPLPTAYAQLKPIYTAEGWRWQNPRPLGLPLETVWATDPADVWLAGGNGTLLHFDGQAWSRVETGTHARLTGIWGDGSDRVWVSGEGVLLEISGGHAVNYSPQSTYRLESIWGSGPTDVWAVGGDCEYFAYRNCPSVVLHYDVQGWSPADHPRVQLLNAVEGRSAEDVWVVGDGGIVLHFDGAVWQREESPLQQNLEGLWIGPDEVWASGWMSSIMRRDASGWQAVQPPPPATAAGIEQGKDLFALWGDPKGEIFVADGYCYKATPCLNRGQLQRFAGSKWSTVFTSQSNYLWDVAGTGGRAWSVSSGGELILFDGQSWQSVFDDPRPHLGGVWGSSAADIWAVGGRTEPLSGELLHFDGEKWAPWSETFSSPLFGVFGLASQRIWAVGDRGLALYFDGESWDRLPTVDEQPHLQAVWASGEDAVWAAGWSSQAQGKLYFYNGTSWQDQLTWPERLAGVWGSGSSPPWAVTADGAVLQWASEHWTEAFMQEGARLAAIWGSGPDDIWAVGSDVLHFDGTSWQAQQTEISRDGDWQAVWGSGPTDVWIASLSQVAHFDGGSWKLELSGLLAVQLAGLWATGSEAWVVGRYGSILHSPEK